MDESEALQPCVLLQIFLDEKRGLLGWDLFVTISSLLALAGISSNHIYCSLSPLNLVLFNLHVSSPPQKATHGGRSRPHYAGELRVITVNRCDNGVHL